MPLARKRVSRLKTTQGVGIQQTVGTSEAVEQQAYLGDLEPSWSTGLVKDSSPVISRHPSPPSSGLHHLPPVYPTSPPPAEAEADGSGTPSDAKDWSNNAPDVWTQVPLKRGRGVEKTPIPEQDEYSILAIMDPAAQDMIWDCLRMQTFVTYHCAFCSHVEGAMRVLETDPPDLVILDLDISGRRGLEWLGLIRRLFATWTLPVLVLSPDAELVSECYFAGANAQLLKPILPALLLAQVSTLLHTVAMQQAASRFVPDEFLVYLDRNSLLEVQHGDSVERVMTIMFADLRGFTSIAQNMTPSETFRYINECYSILVPCIFKNEGFVDKYIGDAVMALFGGPVGNSIQAAIEMQASLKEFDDAMRHNEDNGKGKGRNTEHPVHRLGIGIHTGEVILGTVGSKWRIDTTVLGDSTNLASRIEGLTKEYACDILVSSATFDMLDNSSCFNMRYVGAEAVRGRSEETTLYEVYDHLMHEQRLARDQSKMLFEQGVSLFLGGDAQQAAGLFEQVLEANPADHTAQKYHQRCVKDEALGKQHREQ
uniref:Adenylyl cyclase n=1 Tax=Eutreptiella gymnastica TaxID=73025 RepID=A0A7S1IV83_9EUGL